jgi:hypothetical protein
MKTIRTYRTVAEAGFAQSLLEAAGIDASLPYEFAATSSPEFGIWGIELQVEEQDVKRAMAILDGKIGIGTDPDDVTDSHNRRAEAVEPDDERSNGNPYGILILAAPFILGGMILLLKNGAGAVVIRPSDNLRTMGSYNAVIDPSMVHDIGIIGLLIGITLVLFYFYVRGEIGRNP